MSKKWARIRAEYESLKERVWIHAFDAVTELEEAHKRNDQPAMDVARKVLKLRARALKAHTGQILPQIPEDFCRFDYVSRQKIIKALRCALCDGTGGK